MTGKSVQNRTPLLLGFRVELPSVEAIGRWRERGRMGVGDRVRSGEKAPWLTVVGVVADVKHYGLERDVRRGCTCRSHGSCCRR